MSPNDLPALVALTLIVLVMISFWRQLLALIFALLIALVALGLHQVAQFLHH
jgi:hypothetical protein